MDLGWIEEIVKHLYIGKVVENEKQTHKIQVQVARYTLINEKLYKRPFDRSYLKCLNDMEAQYVLTELHENICGNHLADELWHIALIPKVTIGLP